MIAFLEEQIELCDTEFGNKLLNMSLKEKATKAKTDKWDYIEF